MVNITKLILFIFIIFAHIYLGLLFVEGEKEGIDCGFPGREEYGGIVSKDNPVLYRFHTGYLDIELDQESIKNGVELYWTIGSIKPLSKLDFIRKPFKGPAGRGIFGASHYVLVTTTNTNQTQYNLIAHVSYSDSYGLNQAVYLLSIILSAIITLILYFFTSIPVLLVTPLSILIYFLSDSLFITKLQL